MIARPILLLASCIFLFVHVPPACGLTIKLGSLAPAGSPWDKGLSRLAAEWQKISNGTVELKVYPGGIVGDESDMTRKMRIGQLNAAGLSGVGLFRIYPEIVTVQLPLFIRSNEELDYVLDKTAVARLATASTSGSPGSWPARLARPCGLRVNSTLPASAANSRSRDIAISMIFARIVAIIASTRPVTTIGSILRPSLVGFVAAPGPAIRPPPDRPHAVRPEPDAPPGYLRDQLVLVTNDYDALPRRVPVAVEGLVVAF